MKDFPPSGCRNLPLQYENEFHVTSHPRLRETKFEELCKEGTMPKGRPSHPNEYMWLFVLVNTVSKIQYRDAFSGLSHRGDRPVMTCITTVMYDTSCASVKRWKKKTQQMHNNTFLFLISSESVKTLKLSVFRGEQY